MITMPYQRRQKWRRRDAVRTRTYTYNHAQEAWKFGESLTQQGYKRRHARHIDWHYLWFVKQTERSTGVLYV